tara:strand:- start:580 stop:804 length:225 start_codon:yes stop_codon:yes gene_type:complete
MTNQEKVCSAIKTLKADAEFTFDEEINTESDFNKIRWVTDVDNSNADFPTAVLSETNPHSELTWTKVKEEMDKL